MDKKKARDVASNTAPTTKLLRTSTEKTLQQRPPKPPSNIVKKRLLPVVLSDPIVVEKQSKAQAAVLLKEYERSWRVSLLLFNAPLASH
jgi:hypothetical protein